jgi:cyclase
MDGAGLYKTVKFKDPVYVGDPINAVKIFNEKEVDELVILDIGASVKGHDPDLDLIRDIASEAFMPVAYGGGVTTVEQIQKILYAGVEKVVLNTAAYANMELVKQAAERYGSQSVIGSIDVSKSLLGRKVLARSGKEKTGLDPVAAAVKLVESGAGELMLQSVDRDGTYKGYDLDLIDQVTAAVNVPVIACSGARGVDDFVQALDHGAAAVAAGSLFVFHGPHKAVLINFSDPTELDEKIYAR